jgi:hypothetical protein
MSRKSGLTAVAIMLSLGAAQAFGQDDFNVTLEVLDDVSDVDGVVLILEEQDGRGEDERFEDERFEDDERAGDEPAAGGERDELAERDGDGFEDEGERREDAVEDRELEQDRDEEPLDDEPLVDEPQDEADDIVDAGDRESDVVIDEV